ncbi:1878_t:CDS:2, partial [Diversispora eburnea]
MSSLSSSKTVHEYFEQSKVSDWDIIGFLTKCSLEPYMKKIECYLTSLELIADTNDSQSRKKAQELIKLYKDLQDAYHSSLRDEPRKQCWGAVNSGTINGV